MSREPSRRYVELAVCEDCGRIFHPASMRGSLCMSCAARRAAPKPAEPPRGFVKAICPDCGNAFVRPATVRPGTRCWKCSDKRKKAAERRRKRRVKTPAGFEAAVCPDCGGTFQRPLFAGGGGRKIYCPECADKRRLASCRAAMRRLYARRKVSSEA